MNTEGFRRSSANHGTGNYYADNNRNIKTYQPVHFRVVILSNDGLPIFQQSFKVLEVEVWPQQFSRHMWEV